MLKQNNLVEATTEQGFPTEVGLPVQREVELEDGTKVIVESVTPDKMKIALNQNVDGNEKEITFKTPGEKYVDNGNNLNGIVQVYNESIIEPELVKIEITTKPTKIEYTEGETFNPEGMVVTATYSNETTKEITDYTYEPSENLTLNDTNITITYNGRTAVQVISIVKAISGTITVSSNVYPCHLYIEDTVSETTLFNNDIAERTVINCETDKLNNEFSIEVSAPGYITYNERFVFSGDNEFNIELSSEDLVPSDDLIINYSSLEGANMLDGETPYKLVLSTYNYIDDIGILDENTDIFEVIDPESITVSLSQYESKINLWEYAVIIPFDTSTVQLLRIAPIEMINNTIDLITSYE